MTIDDILFSILKRDGKEMLNILWGLAPKRTFEERDPIKQRAKMEIEKGSVRLIVNFSGHEILVCARI